MPKLLLRCAASALALLATSLACATTTLHYDKPASTWTEALPIGNGRLGAMVFGRPDEELIQLNEATLWSGGPVGTDVNPGAFAALAEARKALAQGDYAAAAAASRKMQGRYSESYLPLGDLRLKQDLKGAPVRDYRRALDIRDGITTTEFSAGGVRYRREVFASNLDQVIVVRLTADRPHSLDLAFDTASQLRSSASVADNVLTLRGKAPAHVDPNYVRYNAEPIVQDDPAGCKGMRFELDVRPIVKDGKVSADGTRMTIKGASEVVLLLSAATSFAGFDQCPDSAGKDEHALAAAALATAAKRDVAAMRADHLKDFHRLFDRFTLALGAADARQDALPTDQRLAAYTAGAADPGLEALYVQFGRYLLISSSRTPDAPANLQGIWNPLMQPPWSSNYTTNINVQMNYWPVESANLDELYAPLDDLIRHLAVTGKETAASYYHANGWVVHHNSDIWAASNPVGDFGKGDPMWANWYMGGAWLARHMWEHYQYTGDRAYLRTAYPVMKEAARFVLDWLQPDGNGRLVTAPSTSPENAFFFVDKQGKQQKGAVSVASTMDMEIARDLFDSVDAAGAVLGADDAFRAQVRAARDKLFPFQVGAKGQLMEWYRDFEEPEPHQRHVSHLYGLYPANQISPLRTPDLAAAARRTLELRGDEGTGWSLAWKVNMWARLLDGDHAYTLFRNLLRLTREGQGHGGGAYPNLFDAHPPFQIDGNFAGTAGVIEMLLQSQDGELHLLPALPSAWRSGAVQGLVSRGNRVVDMTWQDGRLRTARVTARVGGPFVLRTSVPVTVDGVAARSERSTIGYVLRFTAAQGKTYQVRAQSR